MSEVASLELCKELYDLSGWNEDTLNHNAYFVSGEARSVPRYPIGYLLGKLPNNFDVYEDGRAFTLRKGNQWEAGYSFGKTCNDETPENALAKLLIELFKLEALRRDK